MGMEEERRQEIATDREIDVDDDGPPPGFQLIINPQPLLAAANDDEDEDEGPPPGFDSVASKPSPSLISYGSAKNESDGFHDIAKSSKQDDANDADNVGPPPGWEFNSLANALPKPTSNATDLKTESNEEELDEGPPPGWETVLPHQMPPPRTPPLRSSSPVSSNTGNKGNEKKVRIKRPTFSNQPAASPQQLLPANPRPLPQSLSSEKAQLVCGKCRKLCLYPRGSKWVQCPGCQEVNFVLEAHELGQVKCGRCAVLLMYPHGAPAVQCTSCHFVTEIAAHNRRPPLSVQQAQRRGHTVVRAEPRPTEGGAGGRTDCEGRVRGGGEGSREGGEGDRGGGEGVEAAEKGIEAAKREIETVVSFAVWRRLEPSPERRLDH
ncbi:protein lol2 [Phtheirospermum japonicum]|uniref:Protein lol2 n=1 Tax=Phtheirospermum japonicum TaxID=374723 RepID=A0A830C6K2_9LAMI|nr:protein lol2 [Phtheirospermum japonicum]